jgi:hypothetical protein
VNVTHDRRARGANLLDGCLEVRHLESEQDAVAERLDGVREAAMVILDLEVVELQQDLAVPDDLLVLVPAMAALRAEHRQVEPPRGVDIADDDQRLWPYLRSHGDSLRRYVRGPTPDKEIAMAEYGHVNLSELDDQATNLGLDPAQFNIRFGRLALGSA